MLMSYIHIEGMKKPSTTLLMNPRFLHYSYDRIHYIYTHTHTHSVKLACTECKE